MAKKRITRKELLKGEDELVSLSSRVARYVSAHLKQIQYLAFSILIIIIIILGISLYLRHLNKKALAAYNRAYRSLMLDSSPGATEDNLKRSIEEFDELIRKYGKTKMAILSVPQLAYLEYDQGKYDEAISLYQMYLKREKFDSIYASMAHFGLAAVYEAKGDYKSAISHLKKIVDEEHDVLKEEALFCLGRVYALNGQREMSRETFKDFIDQFTESPLLPLAKANLKK
jgi:predicted negative regulator of RcsB-dependent stress response